MSYWVALAARLGLPAAEVAEAVAVLRDPELPGEPWSDDAIVRVMPVLAEGPSPLPVEANGARWLRAVHTGAPLPDDEAARTA